MTRPLNKQIMLAQIPEGHLTEDHFRVASTPAPTPTEGEILVRSKLIPLHAGSRAHMQGSTYRSVMDSGIVMEGDGLGEVVESRAAGFEVGDLVYGQLGWQEYALLPGDQAMAMERAEPLSHLLSVYGIPGLTAYFGLLECGHPKAGETVVVSAAAGAVGSIVCQIARIQGCRVVGITGDAGKAEWLKNELGVDAVVDHRAGNLRAQLKQACPDGIDLYFDNTGGDIFEACLFAMKMYGRIICCGAVASYDGPAPKSGPRGVPGLIVTRRLTLRGFIVHDFAQQHAHALAQLRQWVAEGKLRVQEEIIPGLENAPRAFVGVLAGKNRGKRIISLA